MSWCHRDNISAWASPAQAFPPEEVTLFALSTSRGCRGCRYQQNSKNFWDLAKLTAIYVFTLMLLAWIVGSFMWYCKVKIVNRTSSCWPWRWYADGSPFAGKRNSLECVGCDIWIILDISKSTITLVLERLIHLQGKTFTKIPSSSTFTRSHSSLLTVYPSSTTAYTSFCQRHSNSGYRDLSIA